jgi:hypothetical protein
MTNTPEAMYVIAKGDSYTQGICGIARDANDTIVYVDVEGQRFYPNTSSSDEEESND